MGVVVANGIPDVHAWENGVGGWASLNGTSDLQRVLPDNLGKMGPVTTALSWALLTVKARKQRGLAEPLGDNGILKSGLGGPGS